MALALMSSGGKDGTLALDRARRQGLDVRWFASIFEGHTGRLRFHGVPHSLVEAQARALGLEPVLKRTHPDSFDVAFDRLITDLRGRGCTGVVFGNIALADVRSWYETRVTAAGLAHLELLWG
jgi:diphthamide synthase (EF-2-diphthine--ammonia ligase)